MPAFSHQFDQVDPFEPVIHGPLQAWAARAARMATMILYGCSTEQLTCWGRVVERELQKLAAHRVGECSTNTAIAGQVMTSPAEVRWQLTDIELLSAIDLKAIAKDLSFRDPRTGLNRPVQLWRLRATLALWKLADASVLLRQDTGVEGAVSVCKADIYAGCARPNALPYADVACLASNLITEAAVAVALAWGAYQADFRLSQAAWATALRKSSASRPGGHARHAEGRRAKDLILAWLKSLPLDSFVDITAASNAGVARLKQNDFDPPLKKPTFVEGTVFKWFDEAGPDYVRWGIDRRRKKAA